MAITKEIIYDKKEIIGELGHLQVRKAIVIKEDSKQISRAFERYVLDPGTLDASDNLVDNPLDKEPDGVTAIPQEIKDLCAVVWTTSVKNAWKAQLIVNKPSEPKS